MHPNDPLRATLHDPKVVAIALGAVVSVLVAGSLFFVRGRAMMETQLKERLRATAAVAVLQFDAEEIANLPRTNQPENAAYRDAVIRLGRIRQEIPGVHYAYIMRRTDDPMTLQFVADADAFATDVDLDRDKNGTVEEDEEASFAGDPYDISEIPALQGEAFLRPTVDEDITVDQWGTLISGYAPIRRAGGEVVAVLGLDMDAEEFQALSHSIFSPIALLLFLAAGSAIAAVIVVSLARRRMAMLRELSDGKSSLMSLTSHQLGSPLTIFKWSVEALRDRSKKESLERAVKEHIARMDEGIERMDSVLTALQDADRIQSGTLGYHPQKLSLNATVRDVLRTLPAVQKMKRKIALTLGKDVTMPIDRKLLAGVLRELIDNALNFSPERSVITIRTVRRADEVQFCVIDHGCGIPAKEIPHIFEKFVRGSKAVKLQPNGNGLGLYIAKGIIERAGGRMWITSVEGKGTTVCFTLRITE
ncbi:MAG: ATP-binding protein [Candidatus Peregrinibacteria bacterium]|nr:ATP-binding protein [Candidatus Peregrinibacteria bacterium]